MNARTVTGPGVFAYVNKRKIGIITSWEFFRRQLIREIGGVDQLDPVELAIGRIQIGGTMGLLRAARSGGAEGIGVQVPQDLVSREKYFTLTLVDRRTDTTLMTAERCLTEAEQWSVSERSIMHGTVSWKGIFLRNEAG